MEDSTEADVITWLNALQEKLYSALSDVRGSARGSMSQSEPRT
jgi:hypothetical protein